MNWTNEEKLSLMRVLGDIIHADGRVADNEMDYITQLSFKIGFTPEHVPEAMKRNVDIWLGVLNNMSNEKKVALNIMMMEMIEADGDRDQNEVDIWYAVVKRLGIDKLYKR